MNEFVEYLFYYIAYLLNIDVPEYRFEELKNNNRLCEFSEFDCRLIFRTNLPKIQLVYDMAYAMRRLWQYIKSPCILGAYRFKYETDEISFYNQPAEIDAFAFAYCFCYAWFNVKFLNNELPEISKKSILSLSYEMIDADEYGFKSMHYYMYENEPIDVNTYLDKLIEYGKTHRRRFYYVNDDDRLRDESQYKTSSEKYLWYTDEVYDGVNKLYNKAIKNNNNHSNTNIDSLDEIREKHKNAMRKIEFVFSDKPRH